MPEVTEPKYKTPEFQRMHERMQDDLKHIDEQKKQSQRFRESLG